MLIFLLLHYHLPSDFVSKDSNKFCPVARLKPSASERHTSYPSGLWQRAVACCTPGCVTYLLHGLASFFHPHRVIDPVVTTQNCPVFTLTYTQLIKPIPRITRCCHYIVGEPVRYNLRSFINNSIIKIIEPSSSTWIWCSTLSHSKRGVNFSPLR